jgi:NAD(P)-dependent dehydrogenase (short-subunit alcohol dehydrogenase family)
VGVLDGKVAIVTGAGQGIGRGVALAFVKEGAAVAVVGRTEDKVVRTVRELTALGGRAISVARDVSTREACNESVTAALDAFGGVDILVNNAASTTPVAFEDITDENITSDFGSSLFATIYFMQACFPHMRDKGGKIINFGSGAGTSGSPMHGAYAAAKEGIRGLSKVAAHEWGRYGINVNVVCPGALTPMSEAAGKLKGRTHEEWAARVPLQRIGDAERDIGRTCVFLAGPDSDFITGRTLHIDGGQAAYDM